VPFTVIYDANVLYPAPLRDLLIRLAQTSLVQARWTDTILDECFDTLQRNRPDLDPSRLARTRQLMIDAVRDCLVMGYEPLIEAQVLPDPDDRHVLAAAIRAGAQAIITGNLADFPQEALAPFGIVAQHPDAFVEGLIELSPPTLLRVIEEQEADLRVLEEFDLLTRLESGGLERSVELLRKLRGEPKPVTAAGRPGSVHRPSSS
jgi:predicted nucleic acid-binding protein